MSLKPNFREEIKLRKRGYIFIVGIDEAGRGPLAGPVVAGAVMINQKSKIKNQNYKSKFKILLKEVRDSKKLTSKKREELYGLIIRCPFIEWGIGEVSEKLIDKINIKNAAELAMRKALENLEKKSKRKADFLIIDGNQLKNQKLKNIKHKLIVKADEKVFSCSAASIIAKVWRDGIMREYHKKYPQYGFGKHMGYPTKRHYSMLKKYGCCEIHRKSFRGVKA